MILLVRRRRDSPARTMTNRFRVARWIIVKKKLELAKIPREFHPHKTKGTDYEICGEPKVVMEFFSKKLLEN